MLVIQYSDALLFYRQDSENDDSSSTVSQTSYDPSQPMFKNMHSEIPDSVPEMVETPSIGSTGKSKGERGNVRTGSRLPVCFCTCTKACVKRAAAL